ncbi:MAG: PAS domain S-box protein [Nitrosomonas sp.]|nr:MAG: PAS domain S-box protein [Nitrosomonas sp.]
MKQKVGVKAADDAMADSQRLIGALHRSHCIAEFDPTGIIMTANDNFLGLLGYALEEIRGKHYRNLLDPAYAAGVEHEKLWVAVQQGTDAAGDSKWLTRKGGEVWLQTSFNPIHDDDGEPAKVLLLARDITEGKLVQLAKETEYRTLNQIVNMTSIVSHADLKGHIIDINEKFVQVSKYSREELIGSPHNITRHPDMPKATFKQVWNTIGHGKIFRGVIKNCAKDGTPYYVDAVIAPILGGNGKPEKYIGVRYDITEQEIERQNLKGILSAINDTCAYLELDHDANVLAANQIFLDLLGYRSDEVIRRNHRMFIDSDYANSAECQQFWTDLRNGHSKSEVFLRISKSGEEKWLQGTYAPVKDEMGRVVKIIKIATDITRQIRIDHDYKNRVKVYSEFIGKVAKGDLRQRVAVDGGNELGVIGENLNVMVESLSGIANQIGETSGTLSVALNQIRGTVNTQAAGAAQQATAVNEITVALEEIRAASAENLVKAKQLGEVAERVRREGNLGEQTLEQAVSGMEVIRERVENIAQTILALSEQTQQIGEITEVVSSIAQQSKMLALNASIEAAKAGEAGKGFAVVAAEVKELAIQSQQSTAQVQKILQDIRRATDRAVMAAEEGNKRVDAGVILVEKSGEMMRQLSAVIEEALSASRQIVTAVQQEVLGIDQTTIAMSEINKITAQFVTSVQQTQTSAKDMSEVASRLKDSISIYKL